MFTIDRDRSTTMQTTISPDGEHLVTMTAEE
jgi:hypothetical protein